MTKEFLTQLGISDDLVSKILEENTKDVTGIQEKLNTATQELTEAKTKLSTAESDKAAAVKEVQDKLDAADADKQSALGELNRSTQRIRCLVL